MGAFENIGLDYMQYGLQYGWALGSAVANPTLEFRSSGGSVLAVVTMQTSPLDTSTDGVAAINPPNGETDWTGTGLGYEITVILNGTVASAYMVNRDSVDVGYLTVGTSATDIIVNATAWETTGTYRVTNSPSLTISNA